MIQIFRLRRVVHGLYPSRHFSDATALLTRPSKLLLIIVIKQKRQEVEDLNNPFSQ